VKNNEPISLKLGPTNQKNLLTFGGALFPDTDSGRITFPFSSPLRNRGF